MIHDCPGDGPGAIWVAARYISEIDSAMPLEDLDAYRSDSGSSSQSRNSETVPKYGQWNSDSNATVSDYEDYRIGAKKSTGSLIWTIVKVLHYILISLIFISISCRILFEYTSFTRGKLIMCRNAADFESSMMVSRMVSFFLIAMIYDLLSRFLLNILFFTLFFAVPSRLVDFIAQNIILFERTIQISLRACMIKHESGFIMS